MNKIFVLTLAAFIFLSGIAYGQDERRGRASGGQANRTIEGINYAIPKDVYIYQDGTILTREGNYSYTFRKFKEAENKIEEKFNEASIKIEELQDKYERLKERLELLEESGN
jgi:ATP-dependent helicase/DNAse subunit B